MPVVEDLFLKTAEADEAETMAAIVALEFVDEQTTAISRERLSEGLRHVLSRRAMADLVIRRLAKWKDWSALPRMVELFKTADRRNMFVRAPVINYLRACPLPEAKTQLQELEKMDPAVAERAKLLF